MQHESFYGCRICSCTRDLSSLNMCAKHGFNWCHGSWNFINWNLLWLFTQMKQFIWCCFITRIPHWIGNHWGIAWMLILLWFLQYDMEGWWTATVWWWTRDAMGRSVQSACCRLNFQRWVWALALRMVVGLLWGVRRTTYLSILGCIGADERNWRGEWARKWVF